MGDPDRGPDEPNVVAFRQKPKETRPPVPPGDPDAAGRSRANIAALIFAAILVLVGWLLVQKLGRNARMEDCLMSGRTNCNPISMPDRQ